MNNSMKVTSKSVSQKKRKQKGNKAKEVESWDDIDGKNCKTTNVSSTPSETGGIKLKGKWICGTIPQSEINKMPWGLLDELTDEEYGYYCEG